MDNLTSLLQAYGPAAVNDDVKGAILESIQAWAVAAEGRPSLVYIGEVYKTLQREGQKFPPKPQVASSMFDSSAVSSLSVYSGLHTDSSSLPNGPTPMFACAVEPPSPSRTASTIVETAETSLINNVHRKHFLSHISESCRQCGWTMDAIRN
jgi:hypothetical protein